MWLVLSVCERCSIYFNLTGKRMLPGAKPTDFVDYMKKQLTGEVLWEQTVRQMVFDGVGKPRNLVRCIEMELKNASR